MPINSIIYHFHIFLVDRYMFSLEICRLGNLEIEILKVVDKCKIYLKKGIRETHRPEFDPEKKFARVSGI